MRAGLLPGQQFESALAHNGNLEGYVRSPARRRSALGGDLT
jgi:hypothetical protein